MCQSVPEGYGATPLKDHDYPVLIKCFAGLVAVAVIYGMCMIPGALISLGKYKQARTDYDSGKYQLAAQEYEVILKDQPASERAKMGAAKSYFGLHNDDSDKKALQLLVDIKLDEDDYEKLSAVMPKQYQELFTTTGRKGDKKILESPALEIKDNEKGGG